MACTCKNENGELLDLCNGSCFMENTNKYYHQVLEQQARDPLNTLMDMVLARVDEKIKYSIKEFKVDLREEIHERLQEFFLDGIKEGIKIGRDFYDD